MSTPSSVLCEEQFQCSICLDVFTDPVSTPCGHNFCMDCIKGFWDSSEQCQCPLCKRDFEKRPDLSVNTFISALVSQFERSSREEASRALLRSNAKHNDVACDFCSETKAVKSCLVCLTSYCETHLEPHQRVPALRRHKLIDPAQNLEDFICKKHERPLQRFCRDDQMCVCQFCTESDHKTHRTVSMEQEIGERKTQMRKTKAKVQQMIQDKLRKIKEIEHSVEMTKKSTEKEIADCVELFTALIRSIERSQTELLEVMEEKQKAVEDQAEGFIKDLEQEINDLRRRDTELEQLSHTEDHFHLLQVSPSLCTLPQSKSWPDITIKTQLSVETLKSSFTQLDKLLNEEIGKIPEIKLKRIQHYAVNVTLDPDTVHPNLILSDDGKQVLFAATRQNLPDNPERFDQCINVLGREGFSTGKFYYEVEVKGKTHWSLGMARESINRKGRIIASPKNGFWTVLLRNGDTYSATEAPSIPLFLIQKPQKVGVFVDYEEGLVSFYDADTKSHIYSFTGQSFKEKLYPFFSPSLNHGGKNAAPIIITKVI
ncbi:E3 ubiquitin-protein ligase TRIM39-like isoform X1 [Chanos chanos]|uniref:E3 ubiquitin-protein ligase TRIM39-like isoform X1 n=1 Tax=Chanos chanos TaxID=29144 RepID=A0A6J2VU78_CHACN|nr:E3 ubiquitin-protein ligase TRIM39-like isoform X1 [Chanos chanos]